MKTLVVKNFDKSTDLNHCWLNSATEVKNFSQFTTNSYLVRTLHMYLVNCHKLKLLLLADKCLSMH